MATFGKVADRVSRQKAVLLLAILVPAMIVVLEIGHRYFFFQDDNRYLFLPFMLHNLRAIAGGEIPLFNFHQSLGTPTSIQYASFYPLNYLALGLSKALSGGWFMSIDILAALHLEIAAFGFYYLMRSFRVSEPACLFGAIAWTFCGFVITVGNSWGQILGYAAYLPWILLFSRRQIYGFEVKNYFILLVLRIVDILVGNPQFVVYTATFDFLAVSAFYFAAAKGGASSSGSTGDSMTSTRPGVARFLLIYFSNHLASLIITLPLVLQALHQAAISATRKDALLWDEYAALSYNVSHWLNGIVAPFNDMPANSWTEQQFISHIGYLTVLFLLLALCNIRSSSRKGDIAVLTALAVFAFLWSADIGVTKIFYYLPLYNKLRYPFKIAMFTSFFLVMLATFGFDQFYRKLQTSGRRVLPTVSVIIILHMVNFLVLYALLPQRMFSPVQDSVPFDEPLKTVMTGGRIVTAWLDPVFVGEKVQPGNTVPTLGYNYATLWRLYFFGGYDALMPEKNYQASLERINRGDFNVEPGHILDISKEVPLEYFSKWGVKWYVFEKSIPLINTLNLVKTPYSESNRNILYNPEANAFVFWSDDGKGKGIFSRFRTNSIDIETERESDGKLIVNVLYNPFFVASVDGTKSLIIETDDSQMALDVPKGHHSVVVKYSDPYFNMGLMISSFFLAALGTLLFFMIRRNKSLRVTIC